MIAHTANNGYATPQANISEIARTLRLFVQPGSLGEVRIIRPKGGTSGFFFRSDEIEQAAHLAASFDPTAKGVYVVMNTMDPAVLDGRDTLTVVFGGLTKDSDIARRRFVLIDFDPKSPDRGADDSATSAEKSAAMELRETVYEWLRERGFPEATFCDSGNGGHLLFQVDLPNDELSRKLIEDLLNALSKRFNTDEVAVDISVHNAARITKLYGSVARKGDDRPDRPHRVSKIQSVPDCADAIVTREMIEAVLQELNGRDGGSMFDHPSEVTNGHAGNLNGFALTKPKLILPETFPEGGRHDTLLKVAGAVRSFGANEVEIADILRTFNRTRCGGGKPDDELQKIARDYARKDCNLRMATLIESDEQSKFDAAERQQKQKLALEYATKRLANGEDAGEIFLKLRSVFEDATVQENDPEVLSLEDLIQQNPHLDPPVVEGLLRRSEVANVIAKSKVGKSWFSYGLALSVAAGWDWLGRFRTTRGRVLLIDNELKRPVLANRIPQVAAAMLMPEDFYAGQIAVESLRGRLRSILELDSLFRRYKRDEFSLVIIDAMYRMFPNGMSENDNALMAQVYNKLDQYAEMTGAAFVLVHHASKGSQSDKDVTDVGSGAGSQSRAADTHLILRPHEDADCVVLEAAVRSWAPVQPLALRWSFPIWTPDKFIDPTALKGRGTPREERQRSKDTQQADQIVSALKDGPSTARGLRASTGLTKERINRLVDLLLHEKRITAREVKVRGNDCNEYSIA